MEKKHSATTNDPKCPIDDPSLYPYCYIVRVWTRRIEKKDSEKVESVLSGTGFVVGARVVLTAAHNIDPDRQLKDRIIPTATTYSPAFMPTTKTYGCKEIYIPPEYYAEESDVNEFDWALLVLFDNIDQRIMMECSVPQRPPCREFNDKLLRRLPISIVSFAVELTDDRLRELRVKASELMPTHYVYKVTTSKFQRGGPIYLVYNNQTCFVGIHQAAYLENKSSWGIRITARIIKKIAEMNPGLVLDLTIEQK